MGQNHVGSLRAAVAARFQTIRNTQPMPRISAELPGQLNIMMPVAFDLPQ
jgi:hypothetical protein